MKRLPRGRHGLSEEFVSQNQRERLIAAVTECLYENGYEKTTVSAVGTRAHVSKSDFYRHFASKDDCFVAAYDEAAAQVSKEVYAACEAGGKEWADRVLAALAALLSHLARQPAQANLLLVDGLRGGRDIYDRYQEAVRGFIPKLRTGAPAVADGEQPPQTTDEAVVGGVASLLHGRILAGEAEKLEKFLPEVAEFALTPYLGTAEARRIISAR